MIPYPDFHIFGIEVSAYSLCSVVGMLICVAVFYYMARRRNMLKGDLVYMSLAAIVGMIIGAHILFGITRLGNMIRQLQALSSNKTSSSFDTIADIIMENWNGMVFYGGLIGAMVAIIVYTRKTKLPVLEHMDLYVPIFPLFHTFGRIGCFLAGCCYGIESDFGYAHTHSNGVVVNRFPVQLLEAGLNFLLFLVIFICFIKGIRKGRLLQIYLLVYPVIRFCDEFLRGDAIRGKFLIFSTSQWISIILFIITIIWLIRPQWLRPIFYPRRKRPKTDRE